MLRASSLRRLQVVLCIVVAGCGGQNPDQSEQVELQALGDVQDTPLAETETPDADVQGAQLAPLPAPALPPGDACRTGEVLLVVGNASLNGGDAVYRRRLLSMGYSVRVADDDTNPLLGTPVLIALSSTTESSKIGNRYKATAVPVLTWEHNLQDDLGMTGSDGSVHGQLSSQTKVTLATPANDLTAGLSGTQTIVDGPVGVTWGAPNNNAIVGARAFNQSTYATFYGYPAGAAMVNGTAPARRALLALDDNASSKLTEAGWKLVDQATLWTANAPREPAKRKALLAVENESTPLTRDQALRTRLEQLGFEVKLEGEKDLDPSDANGMDLIVVSESVASSKLKNTFESSAVPLINTEVAGMEALGMVDKNKDSGWGTGQDIEIVSSTHAAAAGLSGTVKALNSSTRLGWAKPNSNAIVIARPKGDASKASVFAYEEGAAMPGGTAPARRLGLFFDADVDLTAEGWYLFDAAARWAVQPRCAAAQPPPPPPPTSCGQALFIVGNAQLNAADQAISDALVNWGFAPVVRTDQASTLADADGKSIIVISASVSSDKIGNRYRNVAVPVLTWEHDLWDDLQMLVKDDDFAARLPNQTLVQMKNVSHPLAAGLNGKVTVTDSPQEFRYGRPSGNAIVVGHVDNDGSRALLWAYDKNVATETGFVTPARRTAVFLSFDTAEDLTADGWKLLKAATLWSIDKTNGSCGAGGKTCFVDADGDGAGGTNTMTSIDDDCTDPGESTTSTDCNDNNPNIYPGAVDTPNNGVDEDCSGSDETTTCVKTVLYVNGNGSSPNAADQLVGTRLTQLGYQVQWIRNKDVKASDASGKALVVISGNGPSGDIGNRLTSITIPILTWEHDLFDELGMSTSNGYVNNIDKVHIAQKTHLLAAGLNGNPKVMSASTDLRYGKPSNAAVIAARSTTDASRALVWAYETGAAMVKGTAAARRVGFFLGDNNADKLTDDGWKLFEAAVAWSVGGGGCGGTECFADNDGDGYGSTAKVTSSDADCSDPGESNNSSDCNDNASTIRPGATEIPANGIDEDCNGADAVVCYVDADKDGYGTATTLVALDGDCTDAGESTRSDDCNDTLANVHPGANDIPGNNVDEDCNGFDAKQCFVDADEDGFGSTTTTTASDGDCVDKGESSNANDCDDSDAKRNPNAVEIPDNGIDEDCSGSDAKTCWVDADHDGYGSKQKIISPDNDCNDPGETATWNDCDDTKANVYPGATETPGNGVDEDCNGVDAAACYVDADGDGYGRNTPLLSLDGDCTDAGESGSNTDCDDSQSAVHPGASEIPGNGVDEDCNGSDTRACFADNDKDGYGSTTVISSADADCDDPGESTKNTDCNDNAATIYPGAAETAGNGVDEDCNGVDAKTCFVDADKDGFGTTTTLVALDGDCTDPGESTVNTDCNDGQASVYPGATEIPGNGVDEDCNGSDARTCFVDADKDGYGTSTTLVSADNDCTDSGESATSNDCDDSKAAVHPGAVEIPANGVDEDCNGFDAAICRVDADKDGFGSTTTLISADNDCTDPGESGNANDCDDSKATVYPGAPEIPGNGVDEDCNGSDARACFADGDNDGFGRNTSIISSDADCDDAGESTSNSDCDDTVATIYPGAVETAGNGIDEDCNGVDAKTCFVDADSDGYGSTTTLVALDGDCTDAGESAVATDCNDTQATINPGATETPGNGIDEDCNGSDAKVCFVDADSDGYGTTTTVVSSDNDCADSGESTTSNDCDDSKAGVHPGATEVPGNGVDEDCNGSDAFVCSADADGDGFGSATVTVVSSDNDCSDAGESTNNSDCDDSKAGVHPGATEVPGNGVDEDCSGSDARLCFVDADKDGFGKTTTLVSADADCSDPGESTSNTDCNDAAASIYPGAPEIAGNGVDEDCNGVDAKTCFVDADRDGFGSTATLISLDGDCTDAGESTTSNDCNDNSATVFPGATEIPGDGIDQDCSGSDSKLCFVDGDADGYGKTTTVLSTDADCNDAGESGNATDCDDTKPAIHPGASDVPDDGVDQDCSGADTVTCFLDADMDGFGSSTTFLATDGDCTDSGESTNSNDCDDTEATVKPGGSEVPDDGIDQDCSGTDTVTCYIDTDHDGFGTSTSVLAAGGDCSEPGRASTSGDCDDTQASIFPGATEIAGDGIDQNCDGLDLPVCYADADLDGYGKGAPIIPADGDCIDAGESTTATDCDDTLASVNPGAPEIPANGRDDNCDGVDGRFCFVDADSDGFGTTTTVTSTDADCNDANESNNSADCNDSNPAIRPGATDTPGNGIDEDCNGSDAKTCFVDSDKDGFGTSVTLVSADNDCTDPGESAISTDCNDMDSTIFPGASETPDDGKDQDCNGVDAKLCFVDADKDSYGSTTTTVALAGSCAFDGLSTNSNDCDDTKASVFPGATEVAGNGVDEDCNGVDAKTCFVDADGDTYGRTQTLTALDGDCTDPGESTNSNDCDDTLASVNPAATEIPGNGKDENCDGNDAVVCFVDADQDGFGTTTTLVAQDGDCTDPGESTNSSDCNDQNANIRPNATDVPGNGVDEDCSGSDARTCFVDADKDGFGSTATLVSADNDCADQGESAVSTDCNDSDNTIFPGATEIPNDGKDQDCSGTDAKTCFVDADKDGFGSTTTTVTPGGTCNVSGLSSNSNDCDDTKATTFPGANEVPGNGVDEDCNGVDAKTCFVDADQDGFGSTATLVSLDGDCTDAGESTVSTDCDDTLASVNPSASDVPGNGKDENCDGTDAVVCFVDADRDGFGASTTLVAQDGDCTDPGESTNSSDCNDQNANIRPNATDVPGNGVDEDCSGSDARTCFVDGDKDGFGTTTTLISVDSDCADPGESAVSTDCNDGDNTMFPGATEVPDDGKDQDCSGTDAKTCFIDADKDGFGTTTTTVAAGGSCSVSGLSGNNTDCHDTNANIFPGAPETAGNGVDEDCNGVDAASCFVDADGDGFGRAQTLVSLDGDCADAGESTNGNDCDDTLASVNPAATDVPGNGKDENCNGADAIVCFVDADLDGFGSTSTLVAQDGDCTDPGESTNSSDCNDTNANIRPTATDAPGNGVDEDCNGVDAKTCFVDADRDGFGGTTTLVAADGDCTDAGESTSSTDCSDTQASIFPGAPEIASDGVDQDCNGVDARMCFVDGDGDSFGSTSQVMALDGDCTDAGESVNASDCNDTKANIFPGATETAGNGIDEDCNGVDARTCFVDGDKDGFGSTATLIALDGDCTDPGESTVSNDCNDTQPLIYPNAPETPDNGIDEDCNGTDAKTCFVDNDRDGFGSSTKVVSPDGDCTDQGESGNSNDCNDNNASVRPGGNDIPGDGIDQDCNGVDAVTCFVDNDRDGFGSTVTRLAIDGNCTSDGESAVNTDCNDNNASIRPGANDIPGDGIDQDCSGADTAICFADNDRDGFGRNVTIMAPDGDCTDLGESTVNTDCNDNAASVFPGAPDMNGDGIDSDCDGLDD